MASSIGSSLRPPRRNFNFRTLGWCAVLFIHTVASATPDYVRAAIAKFSAEIPARWAFTLTTQRDEVVSTERYDPSLPPAERWTLLRHNGHVPTPSELEKYAKLKAANPAPVSQSSFKKDDIEPGSLKIVTEDEERATLVGGFRELSSETDKMLSHLQLRVTINKRNPHIERYTLELREPYSPILGVKMHRLLAQMTFSVPTSERPSLPISFTSDFSGRILFFNTHEKLSVSYDHFTPAP